jgi:hypothetical protein
MPFAFETQRHCLLANKILEVRKIMKRQFQFLCLGVFLFVATGAVAAGVSAQSPGPATTAPSGAPQTNTSTMATSKDRCLNCHGPFDKLAAATTNHMAASGERITPHRYVPHDSKDAKAIPECGNCHQSHPVRPTASDLAVLPKSNVQWCYTNCHHENNFTPCKNCHN